MKATLKKHLLAMFLLTALIMNSFSATIILTSDQQLRDLTDPDKKIDLSTGYTKRFASLREICEAAQKRGDKVLTLAFDEFFRQYREQAGTERLLTPDMDEYVDLISVIARFAEKYDMGMGLSLLSPLELGPAYKKQTGETGQWLHYKVGYRDPSTGKFHVQLWQQLYWTNNKGKFSLKLNDVSAYVFKEEHIPNTPFKVVNREEIHKLKQIESDQWEIPRPADDTDMDTDLWSSTSGSGQNVDRARRINVFSGEGTEFKGYDRVLVVLKYDVPEMDYFSDNASPFLNSLLEKYKNKGINLQHFYSDELHLQQDWVYFGHHDNGQLAQRFYTSSLGEKYQEKYGVPFEEKDILYFSYGPDINSNSVLAPLNVQYVMGKSREEIHKTFLFRDRYYKMLNYHVVDLFKDAKNYASTLFGVEDFGTHGHSSWAESPTVDMWNTGNQARHAYKYEYTPNFVWGNTVQQAAAACYDYFKWGEYLEPTRNDFAELGWNDRNYYGAAMATSLGVINRIPRAYPAFWGMPEAVKRRKAAVNDAFGGATRSQTLNKITGHVHRDVDVLILYPMNLVAVEERFGSWLTQYGYANFITAEKLLELGSIDERGNIHIMEKKYTTLVSLFEPLPNKGLIDFFDQLSQKGGNAIWFGPPPIINDEGEAVLDKWENTFGVEYTHDFYQGRIAAGMKIDFINSMKSVPSQYIMTDFSIDHIHPVELKEGSSALAICENEYIVGSQNGNSYYFGFRPRDDQSSSLGYETRTLFEILSVAGAYKATGVFTDTNDNTEYVSRNSDYLTTRFPNGATVIVKHYRRHKETWPGGFSRNAEEDKKVLEENPLPPDEIKLKDFKVNGHEISYNGRLTLVVRMNEKNELIAFEGQDCKEIEINGKTYTFSDEPVDKIAFMPSGARASNELSILVQGSGALKIPLQKSIQAKRYKLRDYKGKRIQHSIDENYLVFDATEDNSGKWISLSW